MATRHSYVLRQRLDLIAGTLVLVSAWTGSLSLGLAQRQRHDAQLLRAVHEQERLVDEITRSGDELVRDLAQHQTTDPERVRVLRDGLRRLASNLQALQSGGSLLLDENRSLRVEAMRDAVTAEPLNAALGWVERYGRLVDGLVDTGPSADAQTKEVREREVNQRGQELRMLLRGVAAGVESRSVMAVVRASRMQLVLMCVGGLGFLLGVLFLRHLVTTPLHRIAEGIEAMRRTGRLVKLPVIHHDELGIVASGFNHLAEQVEEQKQRLREHIVELQWVNAELDQLANVKDDFLATINHQLRTPLTAIVEGIQLMRDGTMGPLSEDQRGMIQTIHDSAARLTKLIEGVLDLSLLKSGRRPLHRQSSDLAPILRQCQERWQAAASFRTIRLSCSELPPVYMDAEAIRDVMDQLLRNAIRHAPQHSEVTVQAQARDGVVEVAVHDQGAGMSPEQRARLFEPFVHVHTPESPGSEGSGLGLAFCRQLIERHRGSIQADSVEGQGTTLRFALPVATSQFLFTEACRVAQEEAEHDRGAFGLLLATPASARAQEASKLMRQAERPLRRNTHRGDQFVWLDDQTLAIAAVTDRAGLEAMVGRLRGLLQQVHLDVRLSSAVFPQDGTTPGQLLGVCRGVKA